MSRYVMAITKYRFFVGQSEQKSTAVRPMEGIKRKTISGAGRPTEWPHLVARRHAIVAIRVELFRVLPVDPVETGVLVRGDDTCGFDSDAQEVSAERPPEGVKL